MNNIGKRLCCTAATSTQKECKPFIIPTAKKAVIVSTSKDIFRNLALEHWFYKNYAFQDNHMLMLWVNEPCVVIGRHQNPWSECNVPWLITTKTPLARRNSGGGTVYHDGGNLNLTFFTSNAHYHRRTNLEFISDAVYKDYGLRIDINKREDLAIREYKVSGTAAKLARHCAYHHCTFLINADKHRLRLALRSTDWDIQTNATKSIKSKILNVNEEQANITIDSLIPNIARRYLEWNNTNLYDANSQTNLDHLSEVEPTNVTQVSKESLKLQVVTPCDAYFPGLDQIYDDYKSWEWTYGRTPKFSASKMFKTSGSKSSGRPDAQKVFFTESRTYAFQLTITVEAGVITELDVKVPNGYHDGNILQRLQEAQAIIGERYDAELIKRVELVFKDASEDNPMEEKCAINL